MAPSLEPPMQPPHAAPNGALRAPENPGAGSRRALAHDPEIVLGVLVAVFHLDLVAAQCRLARKCHISLIIPLRIGGSVGVRPALDRHLMVAIGAATAAVARGARPVLPVIPVAHIVHENVVPIQVLADGARSTRWHARLLHSPRAKPWRSRLQSRL